MVKKFAFNVGDPVWVMHNNVAVQGIINAMWYTEFISPTNFEDIVRAESYSVDINGSIFSGFDCNHIFKTKDELKKSL